MECADSNFRRQKHHLLIGETMKRLILAIVLFACIPFIYSANVPNILDNPVAVITGGTINGTTIGATTPAAGSFNPLNVGSVGTQAILQSDAANEISQRNGINAQANRLHNTFTDINNGEWYEQSWASNVLTIAAKANGSGTARRIDIVGTPTNDSAAAGAVGEVLSCVLTSGSAVSLTTATTANVCTINTLSAGDWDCNGMVDYTPGATTSITQLQQGLAVTSATLGGSDTFTGEATAAQIPTALTISLTIPLVRQSIAVATQIWLVARASFTASTLSAYGSMRCRRQR